MNAREKKIKILIVDDEENIREILSYLLSKRGFITETAKSGKEALDKILQDKPDIITLDIEMPEMDGLETCRRLKENPDTSDIPIIFLSGQEYTNQIIPNMSTSDIEYVKKPCDMEYLIKLINGLVKL